MKTQLFAAGLFMERKGEAPPGQAVLVLQGRKVPASIHLYETAGKARPSPLFARATLRRPLFLKWKDGFDVLDAEKTLRLGRGFVLHPAPPRKDPEPGGAARESLAGFSGSEAEMLAALCREKGIRGLRQREIEDFSRLSEPEMLSLSEKLEAEGKVKILAFEPLFLVSRESFDFLCEKVIACLKQFHEKQPSQKGILLEKLKKRFDLSEKIFRLAVRTLEKAGQARVVGKRLTLASHEARPSPQEEKILQKLEELSYGGQFQSLNLEEIRREFRLSSERLERLLSSLVERRKIVQGPEGLYIHSHWLDEIIGKVRGLGKKELTVGDFKALTELSRKYAIPLLELLDQMGVTRRRGAIREIL